MSERTELLLEFILTDVILNRAIILRNAWVRSEEEKTGAELAHGDWPSAAKFMEEAVDDMKSFHGQVRSMLTLQK